MKKPFSVGDRVRCYEFGNGESLQPVNGTVKAINRYTIEIQDDNGIVLEYFKQQVRRLRKKEKKVPREIWVNWYGDDAYVYTDERRAKTALNAGGETVHFREVIE